MRKEDRSREAAFIIPMFGLFLLLPPILSIFDTGTMILGVPLLHVYVFSVWLGLVLAGVWLARRLGKHDPERNPPNQPSEMSRLVDPDDGG